MIENHGLMDQFSYCIYKRGMTDSLHIRQIKTLVCFATNECDCMVQYMLIKILNGLFEIDAKNNAKICQFLMTHFGIHRIQIILDHSIKTMKTLPNSIQIFPICSTMYRLFRNIMYLLLRLVSCSPNRDVVAECIHSLCILERLRRFVNICNLSEATVKKLGLFELTNECNHIYHTIRVRACDRTEYSLVKLFFY